MQLSRIRKWSVMLLVVCSIVSLFAGCGKKTPESTADPAVNQSESTPPEEEIEDTTTLSEINTDFGTLYIPQKYEQLLKAEIGSDTVKFITEQDGKTYTLFDLSIGEEVGQLAGTLTDKRGTSRDVVNSTKDLSISELNDLMNQVFPLVQTNLSKLEITELLMLAPKCRGASIQQITIPIKDSYGGMTGLGGRSLFSVDFDTNAQALREFMYGENSDS